jgi:NAD(P)H-hydrate epimerase
MQHVGGITYVTADEMKEIDRSVTEKYGIDVLSLMENAGLAVAAQARRMLGNSIEGKRVGCLTGKGNNGGDGLVAARHLANWGAEVTVILSAPREDFGEVALRQLKVAEAMGMTFLGPHAGLDGFGLLLDALLGYNARGPPRETTANLIRRANDSGVPILAVDIPSGLDPTTGAPSEPTVRAKTTVTLGLPKTGLLNPVSREFVGELCLGDVSIPGSVYRENLVRTPLFARENVVRLS